MTKIKILTFLEKFSKVLCFKSFFDQQQGFKSAQARYFELWMPCAKMQSIFDIRLTKIFKSHFVCKNAENEILILFSSSPPSLLLISFSPPPLLLLSFSPPP